MITISNISIFTGDRWLFDDVSLTIRDDDRIGLIGRNGAGKSTLLKIIARNIEPESGTLTMPSDYTVGYLPQEASPFSDKSVVEETKSALGEIIYLEKTIAEINQEIAEREDYESDGYSRLLEKLGEASDRYEMLGGGQAEAQIERILTGLGFESEDFGRPVSEFSGGWRMRIELAKILLSHPDCILLDEPTNHLDIESLTWLENFLKNYKGAILLVSHDRRFLDNITNRTVEISAGKVFMGDLPYSEFVEFREKQRQQQLAAQKNQQKKIDQTERFIERFRSKATLASRVQSRIKQLEKMERIEIDEEEDSRIRVRFPEPPRSGATVAETRNLQKRYGDHQVLGGIDFSIGRGEKVAFVGRNGEGKTTLSRILAGDLDYEGNLKIGHNVSVGFYSQHQAQLLDDSSTAYDIIDRAATGEMRTRIRSLLGAFLFSGDDIYKKVKVLSGGEKSRLALARLMLEPHNFLILDEPTNHLDMTSKDVLKEALAEYAGALIVVSHDRDFLDGLTGRTVEFRNQGIEEVIGGINTYLEKKRIENIREIERTSKSKFVESASNVSDSEAYRQQQKAYQREHTRLSRQIGSLETEIEVLESKIAGLDELFADAELFADPEFAREKQEEYTALKNLLNRKMDQWSELQEEMESLSHE